MINLEEQEDGSAIMQMVMDKEGKEFLINLAVIEFVKKAVDEFNKEFPNDSPKVLETAPQGIELRWSNEENEK